MATFTGSPVVDPFLSTNELLAPRAALDVHNNALLQQQQTQQQLGAADMEMVGRAASTLLGMDEDKAAAAYPGMIADLQRNGFARFAPAQYPGHDAVQGMVQRGLSVPQLYQYGVVTPPGLDAALKRATAPLPGDGTAPAGGFGQKLAQSESGGDPSQINKGGYTGTYQFGKQRLADLGFYTPAQGENMSDNKTWSGRVSIPPYNVTDQKSFAANPAAQQYAFNAHLADIDKTIANTPGANRFDQNGLRAVAHLGGVGGMQRFVSSGGLYDPADANGTHLSDYYKRFSGGAPGPSAAPPGPVRTAAPGAPVPPAPVGQNPNAKVQIPPPVQGAQTDTPPTIAPSRIAQRTGGTDVAGPGAGSPPPATPAPDTPLATVDANTGQLTWGAPQVSPPSGSAQPAATAPAPPIAPLPPNQLAPQQTPPGPPTAAPATGLNSPQVRAALELNRRAQALDLVVDPSGRAKALAASLRAQAQIYLQADSVTYDPRTGIGTKAVTGEQVSPAKPLPHYVYDPNQHAYVDTTGTNKPEFQPAQRDSAVALRDVMELGPKVANGTATPEEQARYAAATEVYRNPVLRENPVTKETVRVNTRELPAGFPEPTGLGGAPGAAPGTPGGSGPQTVLPGYSPQQQQVERDPAAYKVAESQYDRDAKEVGAIGDVGRQSQADQVRIHEMQDVLQRFSTGPGTEWRTAASAWLQRWLPSAVSGWEKESANLSGSDAAQAFSKLALVGAGTQERGVLGARGGYQAIKLFKEANPNVNLQDATNKSILDMQLISNQANQDYAQSALSHFADNETKFSQTHKYDSLAQFDRNWNAQRNPQVYAGAMGAISGQPVEQWAKGLSREGGPNSEYARALGIVERAKPGTVVNADSGRIVVGPQQGGQGQSRAPVPVRTPAEAARLDPGTVYTTPDGRVFTR